MIGILGVYFLISLVIGIAMVFKGDLGHAAALMVVGILAPAAGGGTCQGAFGRPRMVPTVAIGLALCALAYWLGEQFVLKFFGSEVTGEVWAVIGLVLGCIYSWSGLQRSA
jgi:ABC-type spermidine/putrescine transport system permease subunit II